MHGFSATAATGVDPSITQFTNVDVTKPSSLEQPNGSVTITITFEEKYTNEHNNLQLAIYNSTLQTNGSKESGTRKVGWENAYVSAAGVTIWNSVSGLKTESQANAYGVKGTGTNVNYKVYEIYAEANSTYKTDAEAQAGFAAYSKTLSFEGATASTGYWLTNKTTVPADPLGDTLAVPTNDQTLAISLEENWNGNKTLLGHLCIYAQGTAATDTVSVNPGTAKLQ